MPSSLKGDEAISNHSVIEALSKSFEYFLAIEQNDTIRFARSFNHKGFGKEDSDIVGKPLSEAFDKVGVSQFRLAMEAVEQGTRGKLLFAPFKESTSAVLIRVTKIQDETGLLYLFFGDQFEVPDNLSEWENRERARELACIYAVAEWIEVSPSVSEFFDEFPNYLRRGMHNPEDALVYVTYLNDRYGIEPQYDQYITDIIVNSVKMGEIRVGYRSAGLKVLPEERKMLKEIVRMLNLALERKIFRDRLRAKEDEEAEYSNRVKELEAEIANRTREIEEQKTKLNTVNSYFEKISKDWESSRIRLETLFEAIPDKVAIIDRNRTVLMTNREDLKPGYKCHKTFFDSDKPCQDCRLARIIRDKTPIHIEIKTEEDEYFEVHAIPIFNNEHEVEGIIEFYKNITLEKTYQQQLQQADKLASLGQLVSGIGHEINNPNQFIRGNIKIIKQAFEDMLPIVDDYVSKHPDTKIARLKYDFFRQHIMTLVNDMEHGSVRIKGIVEGLKNFARKDEGLLIDTVDLNSIVDASARLVHNQVHKRADIKLDLQPDIPTIIGNAQKIEQVLINLIINASEAMPEDRRGNIEVSTRYDGSQLTIEVKDDGKGMTERTMARIFDPFFTTRRAKGGTGLGLAIAFSIIEEHGGTITPTSKLGVGTTFTIRIPAKRRSAKMPAAEN